MLTFIMVLMFDREICAVEQTEQIQQQALISLESKFHVSVIQLALHQNTASTSGPQSQTTEQWCIQQ